MEKRRSIIAPEGLPYLGTLALIAWLAALFGFSLLSLLLGLLTVFVAFFFRDPERIPPNQPGCVLAPADGTVTDIDKVIEPHFLEKETVKIGVFLSLFDCHVNRLPIGGRIKATKHVRGRLSAANLRRASVENERHATLVEMEDGREVVVVQVAGLLARRIVFWKDIGDVLEKGERFGMIKFGSRVDVYLPLSFKPAVRVGDKVRAGESIIGWMDEGG
jgi:phosphatidylserine decarboxylase